MITNSRNNFFLAFLLSSFVLFAPSCVNENLDKDNGADDHLKISPFPSEINATAPVRSDVAQVSSAAVKTIPDGTKVYWEDGDQVALFPGAITESDRSNNIEYVASLDVPSASATFVRISDQWQYQEGLAYLAAYPSSAVDRWGTNTKLTTYMTLPSEQVAVNGGWDKNAGLLVASSRTPEFFFEHAVAYLKFSIDSGVSDFTSVQVAWPDLGNTLIHDHNYSDASVVSQLGVYYNDGGESSIKDIIEYQASGASGVLQRGYRHLQHPSSKVVLKSPDGNYFKEGTYYVTVMPKTYTNGLNLVFRNGNGTAAVKSLPGTVVLKAGDVANVGTISGLNYKPEIQNHTIWNNEGVVFWVDEADPSKAKIVSTCNHQELQWSTQKKKVGATTYKPVENYEAVTDEQDFTSVTYPAVAFCKSLRETYGGNWHLPSIEEMRIMINSYYGHNYIRPFAHAYDDGITRYPIDYRYPMHNQSSAQYQEILACKKNFDDLLTALPRTDESLNGTYDSLDGVSVDNTQAEYAIDSNSKTDDFGDNNGVIYWLSRESSDGSKAYIARFGVFYYDLSEKTSTSNKYVRCIKDVSLD